ncbi:SEC-C domain-containing protein [Clostridium bowmanii]|uniref:SEC-C metal-binding domain-containing protein n=1 Tax=Clostridium bowmanii TaxID=132925 RepID=UPI001C0AD71D|nr:SEC-C metal-binding domain-containing protein [Clostridium bowmanii]MBU3188172.1 SEC-C domain-containing protein [Clostridium bowmanii]MCA1072354.1 SEC-C domain-containing protein [Clostridium bowmanii]
MNINQLNANNFCKMFTSLNKQVSLYETLATYTKNDLDEVRKDLCISGISSLNKQKLAMALDANIKALLPEILKKFTDSEYKLLRNMMKHNGILEYKDEFSDVLSYLRRFGIIGCFKDNNDENYIFIPEDILMSISALINNLNIVSEIKQNEKVTKLLKGLLFYYGVLPFQKAHDMITNYTKKHDPMVNTFNIIYESFKKDDEVYVHNDYWCSKQVRDPEELITQQDTKSNINYFSLNEEQVLNASEFNFVELNEYDRELSTFLCDNFEVSKDQVLEYIQVIKLKFKIGYQFNEIVEEFSVKFEVENLEQLKQPIDLIIVVYNNSTQWRLKGHSPGNVSKTKKNHQQPIVSINKQGLNTKVGRNDTCPCGSGKKYKNCCLK